MSSSARSASGTSIIASLLILYVVWGSTYLAIRFALHGYAPMFFPGVRFLTAGTVLYTFLRLRGAPNPPLRQWFSAGLIAITLLIVGNGFVVMAERSVSSGFAALAVATVPLWSALFGMFWGEKPAGLQWLGLVIGFAGIVVLNLDDSLTADPLAAVLLATAAVSWSLGSAWARRIDVPPGLMGAACEMLLGGVLFLIISAIRGESWVLIPSTEAFSALLYLTVFGSLIAFSAYVHLNAHTSAAFSTSYAYVNPVIAVVLGVLLGGETISRNGYVAMVLVLIGVAMIIWFNPRMRGQAARETN
jgi:drug/metabolite transporter (DMT)-like permease